MSYKQHKVYVDDYRKIEGSWVLNSYSGGEAVLLDSIGLSIPIETIYSDVLGHILD
ncbi:MAG TPA: hypothetical protein VIM41_16555 [Gammaproteobacteria bacterium]